MSSPDVPDDLVLPTRSLPDPVTRSIDPLATVAGSRTGPACDAPTVPGYEIIEELGRGGMGVVFKARHVTLNRTVALKMLLTADPRAAIRFLAEAEAVAAVRHPHVVQVFEFGDAGGRPYLAMEYLPGESLADRLKALGPLEPRAAARLLGTLAGAVQAAHDQGIVHRDLKPGNVLFDAAGAPKVTDFGLAKRGGAGSLTATQAVMGTPAYMSPEQACGDTKFVGPQADVYALGVILYECLTRTRPFEAADPIAVLRRVVEEEPERPGKRVPRLPRDIELVCLKCLAKDPAERYATAKTLAEELERFAAGEPVTVRPAGLIERGYKWARRKPTLAAAYGLGALAAVLLLAAGAAVRVSAERAETRDRLSEQLAQIDEQKRIAERERDLNDTLRVRAEGSAQAARSAQTEAEKANALAAKAQEQLLLQSYINDVNLAYREWLAGRRDRADELLRGCPERLRDWEWNYVAGLLRSDLGSFPFPGWMPPLVSSDWTRIAWLAPDGSVKVFDSADMTELCSIPGNGVEYRLIELDSALGRLVTLDTPYVLKTWDIRTGRKLAERQFDPNGAPFRSKNGVAVSRVAESDAIAVWDAASGARRRTITLGKNITNHLALSPDGLRVASDQPVGEATVWDTRTGERLARFVDPELTPFLTTLFDPGGRAIALNTGSQLFVLDVESGTIRGRITGHRRRITAFAFDRDGNRIATGGEDGFVRVWDARTCQVLRTIRGGGERVGWVEFGPDGSKLASWEGGRLRVWDLNDDDGALTFRPPGGVVADAVFGPDGPRVLVATPDRVEVWDPVARRRVAESSARFGPGRFTLGPDARRAAHSESGRAILFDTHSGAHLASIPLAVTTFRPVENTPTTRVISLGPPPANVAFSPDGRRFLAVGPDGSAVTHDAASGAVIRSVKAPPSALPDPATMSWAHAPFFTAVGARVLTKPSNRKPVVWDADTGAEVFDLPADRDWDARTGLPGQWPFRRPAAPEHANDLTGALADALDRVESGLRMMSNSAGTRVISVSIDGLVVREFTSGKELLTLPLPEHPRGAVMGADGRVLVLERNQVRIFAPHPRARPAFPTIAPPPREVKQ